MKYNNNKQATADRPQIADITEDCAKTPPFWPLLRPKRPDSERPEKFFRTVLNHFSVYIQIPFTFSEIELPYLKDPEGFSLAVSRTLSLSLCFPVVLSCSLPHLGMASKTRKFRFQTPSWHGLKNAIFDPLIPILLTFCPAQKGPKFHFCNKKKKKKPPVDYNFCPDTKLDSGRCSFPRFSHGPKPLR